ncbi:MAG: hypothetical protein H6908_05235 [Hyphomicrobiales bacterium]|nr:hypothetical protein [Hyphomicrobiales bacterium]
MVTNQSEGTQRYRPPLPGYPNAKDYAEGYSNPTRKPWETAYAERNADLQEHHFSGDLRQGEDRGISWREYVSAERMTGAEYLARSEHSAMPRLAPKRAADAPSHYWANRILSGRGLGAGIARPMRAV